MAEIDLLTALLAVVQAAFVGVLMGVIGGGGGSVYVLLMTLFTSLPPARAVGTGLLLATCGSATASSRHLRDGRTSVRAALPVAACGAAAAATGGILAHRIPPAVLTWAIVVVFVALGALPFLLPTPADDGAPPRRVPPYADGAVGAAVGLAAGTVGVSGGAPLASWFGAARGLGATRGVATALVAVTATSAVGAATHVALGQVDWTWFALLAVGGVIGSYAGARLTSHVPQRPLMLGCGALSVVTAVALLART
ncbi:MAG TPA: sulfite exporter TauE/SafE family protein [Mycobacteriales bacterium]|nr:sulfite exporter TauE/SafE family protein [Mycobacteriales bacterium]